MDVTIYQCLLEAKKANPKHFSRLTNSDKKIIGDAVITAWRLVSPNIAPEKIVQQEITKKGITRQYLVNKYPTEFKIVITNIINDYIKKKGSK